MSTCPAELLLNTPLVPATEPRLVKCEADWEWSPAPLKDFDIWCVLDGEGTLELDEEVMPLQRGRGFVLGPGDRPLGRQDPRKPLTVFFMHFDLEGPQKARTVLRQARPDKGRALGNPSRFERRARKVIRLWRNRDPWSRTSALLQVKQLLVSLLRPEQVSRTAFSDERVERALEAVEQEPGRFWDVAAVAEVAGLSRTQFNRVFQREMGIAPVTYIIRRRMERARFLLRESRLSISQIADTLGYRDVYFFSRQFRQATGESPRTYRKKARPVE